MSFILSFLSYTRNTMKSSIRTIRIKTKNTQTQTVRNTSFLRNANKKNTAKNKTKKLIRSVLLLKSFQYVVSALFFVSIISSVAYGAYSFVGSSVAEDVIVSKSEIVKRVTKFITLPDGEPEAVVRVEDAETLKKQNGFYEGVKEGDYILVYQKIAIIYDLRNDAIVGLKSTER